MGNGKANRFLKLQELSKVDLFWEVVFCPPPSSGIPIKKLMHFDRASFASVVFSHSLQLYYLFYHHARTSNRIF